MLLFNGLSFSLEYNSVLFFVAFPFRPLSCRLLSHGLGQQPVLNFFHPHKHYVPLSLMGSIIIVPPNLVCGFISRILSLFQEQREGEMRLQGFRKLTGSLTEGEVTWAEGGAPLSGQRILQVEDESRRSELEM